MCCFYVPKTRLNLWREKIIELLCVELYAFLELENVLHHLVDRSRVEYHEEVLNLAVDFHFVGARFG